MFENIRNNKVKNIHWLIFYNYNINISFQANLNSWINS